MISLRAKIDLRFTSGNEVDVERAFIRAEEWDAVKTEIDRLTAERDELNAAVKRAESMIHRQCQQVLDAERQRDALLRALKDRCRGCRRGWPIYQGTKGWWHGEAGTPDVEECEADPITHNWRAQAEGTSK